MMRLVKKYHPDLVQETHLHLAGELAKDGAYTQAEAHYIDAGDWKAAVNMYRAQDMWDAAYRVNIHIPHSYKSQDMSDAAYRVNIHTEYSTLSVYTQYNITYRA